MPRGYAPSKKDGNQNELEKVFIISGYSVSDTHAVGTRLLKDGTASGALDMFVAKHGVTILVECKVGEARLNPAESAFFNAWRGEKIIARDIDHALDECEMIMRRWIPF